MRRVRDNRSLLVSVGYEFLHHPTPSPLLMYVGELPRRFIISFHTPISLTTCQPPLKNKKCQMVFDTVFSRVSLTSGYSVFVTYIPSEVMFHHRLDPKKSYLSSISFLIFRLSYGPSLWSCTFLYFYTL